ncbi:Hint domain-containing protein [Paracoccus seriniphilus]|uniref:Hint domain-containing protein n=1 Tax=Paracoccus seriniphilus TaxID=184748 RepID=UPI00356A29EB
MQGVTPIGDESDLYTVTLEQVNTGVDEVQNGQLITITDAGGNVILGPTGVNPDAEQGRAAGDQYLLLTSANYLIDLRGITDSTIEYTIDDEFVTDDDGQLDFIEFPCFTPGTMIETPRGPVDVAHLKVGDLIRTADQEAVPITWIGRSLVELRDRNVTRKPVLLMRDCLGKGKPFADTIISPDHRVLISDPGCEFLFKQPEVLAISKGLAALPKVRHMRGKNRIEYISIFTQHHQIIFANGLAVETLYPGKQALQRLLPLARAKLLSVCPAAGSPNIETAYPPARPLLTMAQTDALTKVMLAATRVDHPAGPESRPDLNKATDTSVRRKAISG